MDSVRSLFGTVRRKVTSRVISTVKANFTQVRFHQYVKVPPKGHKGRVAVRCGGSSKGTTLKFGDCGMRLVGPGVRLTAKQLREAENVLMRFVRQVGNVQLIPRISTVIAVCIKGNETRMGKGKGAFDHWAARVPTGKVIFEIIGDIHTQIAKEAFRQAAEKLPGKFQYIDQSNNIGLVGFEPAKPVMPTNVFKAMEEQQTKEWKFKQLANSPEIKRFR
ncbi:mitochondrial 54S ribosomal protein uL16m [Lipomyces oligophaga]|uniref:mitochondrial 54S ribosomal protein uL16m n=1 Tax=Lipomyces oligophaga TaxID=45792 RepID=UPI0034CFD1E3